MIKPKLYQYRPTEELPFLIEAAPGDANCDFKCYECVSWVPGPNDEITLPTFNRKTPANTTTTDLAEAQVYLSGHIKWDGCANFRFDEQDRVMLHFCGRNNSRRVDKLFDRLYQIASELIPFWSASDAE